MSWVYKTCGAAIYTSTKKFKPTIVDYLDKNEIKLNKKPKENLLSQQFWNKQLELLQKAEKLMEVISSRQYNDINVLQQLIDTTAKQQGVKLDAKEKKLIIDAISWINEEAEPV